jgi:hypothetical protein
MITIPFAPCINLEGSEFYEKVSSIVKVYRTEGAGDSSSSYGDPAYMQQ